MLNRWYNPFLDTIYGSRQANSYLPTNADNEDLDQPVHPCSLIWTFAVSQHKHWTLYNISLESEFQMKMRMCEMNLNICILRMVEETVLLGADLIIFFQRPEGIQFQCFLVIIPHLRLKGKWYTFEEKLGLNRRRPIRMPELCQKTKSVNYWLSL